MRVLIACEESQAVCKALRKLGHEAYSCDIVACSGGHPEWHIEGDCLPFINGNCTFKTADGNTHTIQGQWDLLIAHPPCTYLSNAGARWLYAGGKLNEERYALGLQAKEFFMTFLRADCSRIAVENPIPSSVYELPAYTQIIQPYEYGHPWSKKKRVYGSKGWSPWSLPKSLRTTSPTAPLGAIPRHTTLSTKAHPDREGAQKSGARRSQA